MTPAVRLALAMLAPIAALVSVTTAVAGKGGASPGVQLGGRGIAAADGALRYLARHRAGVTTVTAIDRDGQVARTGSVTGVVGIPRSPSTARSAALPSRRPPSGPRFASAGLG